MESYHAHQLILSTDKRNPSFTLYASEDGQFIRVFYGLELMEEVPDDPDDVAYKMLVGRLYNAGVLVAKLEEVFKADRKTIRSWGLAILSRNPEHLARVLLGRGVNPPPKWQPMPGEAILCDHVGMLIFAGSLSTIAQATSPPAQRRQTS